MANGFRHMYIEKAVWLLKPVNGLAGGTSELNVDVGSGDLEHV